METRIRIESLSKRYGSVKVLDVDSFDIAAGTTAIVGDDGAGKSTLLSILATADRRYSGSVSYVDGQDAVISLRDLRRNLGWAPQNMVLPADATVFDVLAYAAWLRELPRRSVGAAVEAALEAVKLTSVARSPIRRLSRGMRQRVVLGQAFVNAPTWVFLDEPDVGLDPDERSHFVQVLRALASGVTVLYAMGRLEDVLEAADRVTILSAGTLGAVTTVTPDMDWADLKQLVAVSAAQVPQR